MQREVRFWSTRTSREEVENDLDDEEGSSDDVESDRAVRGAVGNAGTPWHVTFPARLGCPGMRGVAESNGMSACDSSSASYSVAPEKVSRTAVLF